MELLRKILVSDRLPNESSHYLTDFAEDNELIFDNEVKKFFNKSNEEVEPEYWYEPITIDLDSEEMLPAEFRLMSHIIKSINEGLFEPLNPQVWYDKLLKYHKALEAAELQILNLQKVNINADERYNKALNELSFGLTMNGTYIKNKVDNSLKIAAYGTDK
jgi:hypothetical protein